MKRIVGVAVGCLVAVLSVRMTAQTPPAGSLNLQLGPMSCQDEQVRARALDWKSPEAAAAVSICDRSVTAPTRLHAVAPAYTPEAMRSKIQGTVVVVALIGADGKVKEVQVERSLDRIFGLDDQAIKAVMASTFTAAKRDGVAVPALVTFDMQFALR